MGLFNRGDHVEVTNDHYPEENGASFNKSTGVVTGTTDTFVTVQLDGNTRSHGFEYDEIQHTR